MIKEDKIEIAKQVYNKLDLKDYSLEIKRDDEINADYIWIANMRGPGGLIIDDNGYYLFCQSAKGYDYWKEQFKNGIRSNKQ